MKKRIISYSVTFAVGCIIALLTALYCNEEYGLFEAEAVKVYTLLSDVFLVPAAALICIGLLVVVSDEGFFDIFGFAFSNLFYFFSKHKDEMARETYYEYHQKKMAVREGKNKWFMVITGLVFMIPCIVFTILYLVNR